MATASNDKIKLLNSHAGRYAPAVESDGSSHRPRQVQAYNNLSSSEVAETKEGSQKRLTGWKAKHGAVTVESWLTKCKRAVDTP